MKKLFACLVLFLFTSYFAFSRIVILDFQTLGDTTTVSFFVVNDSNNLIFDARKSDFSVLENGFTLSDFSFKNVEPPQTKNSTNLFLFDLSIGNIEPENKVLAIAILDTFLKVLPNSKKALIGFDFENYLFSNFTFDSSEITKAIQYVNLKISSGSDFDTAFLSTNLGSIDLIKKIDGIKNIVLISDKNREFQYTKILELAKQSGIKIFFLLINEEPNSRIVNLARNLNSFSFSIKSLNEFNEMIPILSTLLNNGNPYNIEWKNLPFCNQFREIIIKYKNKDTIKFATVITNPYLPQLTAIPPFLRFSSVIPFQNKDLELNLIAKNFDIKIDSFKLNSPFFKIISGNISNPIILPKDSAHKLIIRFTPTDSSIVFDSLVIFSNACNIRKINITGGFPNKKPRERTLSITSPKCYDYYFIGDTIAIKWDGLLPTDVVQLQFSTDGGNNWDTLAINVLGLEYKFYLDPKKFKETDSLLIRVIQIWPNNAGETIELRHQSSINSANFNRDASLIITSTNHPEEFATLWNPGTGRKLFQLKGHTKQVNWACFDYQDRYAITASDDSTAILYDIKTGDSLFTFKAHKSKVTSANFSPDGNYLLTSGTDGKCFVWDLNSKKIVHTINNGINPIYFANFTPDSNFIAFASYDGNIYLFDIQKLSITKKFVTKFLNNHIHHFSIHLGNKKLAAASHLGLIFVFDYDPYDTALNVYPTYVLAHDTLSYPAINTAYFNSNGNWLITSGSDSKVLRWNTLTGELIDSIAIAEHSNSITSALFSFDDAMLLTSSWDSTAKIFNRTKLGLQIDTNDCFVTITKPNVISYNVDFGKVFINKSKDTIVKPVIVNQSNFPVTLRNIRIVGTNSNDFSLLTNVDTITIQPNDTLAFLLNFCPSDVGARKASIIFDFKGGYSESLLTGEGIVEPLKISNSLIDIGEVEVGEFKDTLLKYVVKNQSNSEIRLLSIRNIGPDSLYFSIIDGGETTIIQPNSFHPITIRFTPNNIGVKNTLLEFITDADSQNSYLNLLGEGVLPVYDSITISIGNYEAKPGDIVSIPIVLKNKHFVNQGTNYLGLGFDLSFNKTILEPFKNNFQSKIDNNIRTLKVIVEKNFIDDSVLASLEFRVGLGNDTLTPLTLSNSYPLGRGKIVIKEESGKLVLKDLCNEGGTRLFEPDGKIKIGSILPNPTEGLTQIIFHTAEDGKTKLELYDFAGNLIDILFDSYLEPGEHKIVFDAREYDSGIYLLILRTPNSILTKKLFIVK